VPFLEALDSSRRQEETGDGSPSPLLLDFNQGFKIELLQTKEADQFDPLLSLP